MEDPRTKGDHYQDRAMQMRDLAAKETDLTAKKSLIGLAETYDQLSKEAYDRASARKK